MFDQVPSQSLGATSWLKIPFAIFGFLMTILRWTAWALFLPFYPFHAKVSKDHNQVWATSMPKIMFAWPLVPGAALLSWLCHAGVISTGLLGWSLLVAFLVLVILLAEDLNIVAVIIIGIILGLLLALAQLANLQLQIPVLSEVAKFFKWLHVEAQPGFGYGCSVIFGLLLAFYGLPRAYLDGRHEFTTRGIEHVRFGRQTDLTPSAGRTIVINWPDMLEFLVGFGAGSVEMRDRGGHVIKKVENVFGLYFVHAHIEKVFEASGVRAQVDEDDHMTTTGDV